MIQKIKVWWMKLWMNKKQRKQFKEMKRYYELLRTGAEFINFIRKDLRNQKEEMNRHARRRMEKSLIKGEITEEIVKHYAQNITNTIEKLDTYLNSKN